MKIAILGAGAVGTTLAARWLDAGHEVTLAVREPSGPKASAAAAATGGRAPALSVADACAGADVVLLATRHEDAAAALAAAGELAGKVVLDATNPLLPALAGLSVGHTISAAERIQRLLPAARVVKAFNCTGAEIMADPILGPPGTGRRAAMFVAGDDTAAKATALRLAADCGFEAVDAGDLAVARLLEPLAMLWISLAFKAGLGRDFAFVLGRREGGA